MRRSLMSCPQDQIPNPLPPPPKRNPLTLNPWSWLRLTWMMKSTLRVLITKPECSIRPSSNPAIRYNRDLPRSFLSMYFSCGSQQLHSALFTGANVQSIIVSITTLIFTTRRQGWGKIHCGPLGCAVTEENQGNNASRLTFIFPKCFSVDFLSLRVPHC